MKPFFHPVIFLTLFLSLLIVPVQAKPLKNSGVHKEAQKKSTVKRPVKATISIAARGKAPTNVAKVRKQPHSSVVQAAALRSRHGASKTKAPAALYDKTMGFNASSDALGLKSNAVLVIDQNTNEVLMNKNASVVLPIASLTKLMTGLVIADAQLSLDEQITILDDDVDTLKGSGSRLNVGTTLSRGELLHLALMSSENRAAHALGRTFPGGLQAFVAMMNVKAKLLGMNDTRYVDPTGLSPQNQSSASDLATLVSTAHQRQLLREFSTSDGYQVDTGRRTLQYHNTNRLISSPHWEIGLQKTGYIAEAGRCLVMQAKVAGRQLIMIFLDSAGKLTRIADAERVRQWVERM